MKKLDSIWQYLEEGARFQAQPGFDYEYWDTQLPASFRVAFDCDRKIRMFHIGVSQIEFKRFNRAFKYQGLTLEKFQDIHQRGFWISLALQKKEFTDVFTVLCEDIISAIGNTANERRRIQSLIARLEAWKSLFSQAMENGLSKEKQLGLWGELYVLHEYLLPTIGTQSVTTWKGPKGYVHDFQSKSWAIEIKTQAGNAKPDRLKINGEQQLEDRGLDHLFLVMLSVARRERTVDSLPELVEKVEASLAVDPSMLQVFRAHLLEVGYFSHHRPLYENTGYTIREEKQWKVFEGFPRIREKDLPAGINDVTYSLSIVAIKEFEVDWSQIQSSLHP